MIADHIKQITDDVMALMAYDERWRDEDTWDVHERFFHKKYSIRYGDKASTAMRLARSILDGARELDGTPPAQEEPTPEKKTIAELPPTETEKTVGTVGTVGAVSPVQ